MTLEDIVRYENEGTALDFKRKQYPPSKAQDLIKDVMAMANADVHEERHIIIGVDHQSGGTRSIVGVPEDEFVDDADYQQLLKENIEPDIPFSYKPHNIQGKTVGVFVIGPQLSPPYLMRKDYGSLRRGEGWIRKGSHQCRLTKADYDRIYQRVRSDLGSEVSVGYGEDASQTFTTPNLQLELPSNRAYSEISAIIAQKEKDGLRGGLHSALLQMPSPAILGYSRPYKDRPLEELRRNLAKVRQTYLGDDLYELQESAFRLDLWVSNGESEYLRNSTLVIKIPKTEGIYVVETLSPEPDHGSFPIVKPSLHPERMSYPSIRATEETYVVRHRVGDIINHSSERVYSAAPRIVLLPGATGQCLKVSYRLHAENLEEPVSGEVALTVGDISMLYPGGIEQPDGNGE